MIYRKQNTQFPIRNNQDRTGERFNVKYSKMLSFSLVVEALMDLIYHRPSGENFSFAHFAWWWEKFLPKRREKHYDSRHDKLKNNMDTTESTNTNIFKIKIFYVVLPSLSSFPLFSGLAQWAYLSQPLFHVRLSASFLWTLKGPTHTGRVISTQVGHYTIWQISFHSIKNCSIWKHS